MGSQNNSEQLLTTAQVSKITGLTVRKLRNWADLGLAPPSVSDPHGQGTRKIYAQCDIEHLLKLKKLLSAGWSIQKLGAAMKTFRSLSSNGAAIVFNEFHDQLPLLLKRSATHKQSNTNRRPKGHDDQLTLDLFNLE